MRPPESDLSLPARMRISEVLPVPLGAIRAILSPSLMLKPMFSKRTFGPYDFDPTASTEAATAADITTRTANAATRAKATAKDAATKEAKDAATTMNR